MFREWKLEMKYRWSRFLCEILGHKMDKSFADSDNGYTTGTWVRCARCGKEEHLG